MFYKNLVTLFNHGSPAAAVPVQIFKCHNCHHFQETINPIWAGLWNDVVDWGGALSARIQFLEGSPL